MAPPRPSCPRRVSFSNGLDLVEILPVGDALCTCLIRGGIFLAAVVGAFWIHFSGWLRRDVAHRWGISHAVREHLPSYRISPGWAGELWGCLPVVALLRAMSRV